MADEHRVRLHNVSVVVTAEFHNPSILNPDFLASHGIVPEDWTVAETVTTPPVSVVKYENGISWTVDQSRLTITENCGPTFQDSYRVHALVDTYLEKLPHVPYRELGLNYQLSTLQSDPGSWIVAQFAADWLRHKPGVCGMKSALTLDMGDALCNIAFADGTRDNSPCVAAECNVHHRGRLDMADLRAAIARWPERQEFVASTLDWLLEEKK